MRNTNATTECDDETENEEEKEEENKEEEEEDAAVLFSPDDDDDFQPVPSAVNTPMNAFQRRDQRYEEEENENEDRESTSPMVFGRGRTQESDASNGQDFLAQTKKNQKDDSAKASPDGARSEEGEEDVETAKSGGGEMEDENVEMKSPLAFLFQKNKRRKENNKNNGTPKEYDRDSHRHGAMWASIGSPAFPHKNQSRVMNANNFNGDNNNENSDITTGMDDTNNTMNDAENSHRFRRGRENKQSQSCKDAHVFTG